MSTLAPRVVAWLALAAVACDAPKRRAGPDATAPTRPAPAVTIDAPEAARPPDPEIPAAAIAQVSLEIVGMT